MMKKCQCGVAKLCGLLVFIGGLNWGLVGLGMLMGKDWNVVHMILSFSSTVEAIVYLLVGIAAIMALVGCKCAKCKSCEGGAMPMGGAKM
jgi:uncharacterized membrane protein YuzA (DUF378 family)